MSQKQSPPRPQAEQIKSRTNLDITIDRLESASRDILTEQWRKLYRGEPPKGASRRLLIGAVAYALQMRQKGGSGARLRRRLEQYLEQQSTAAEPRTPRKLMPGARLIRDWNGSTHTVDVTAGGYLWNGKQYRSLSAIARAITGVRWSGPRFFGLGQDGWR